MVAQLSTVCKRIPYSWLKTLVRWISRLETALWTCKSVQIDQNAQFCDKHSTIFRHSLHGLLSRDWIIVDCCTFNASLPSATSVPSLSPSCISSSTALLFPLGRASAAGRQTYGVRDVRLQKPRLLVFLRFQNQLCYCREHLHQIHTQVQVYILTHDSGRFV